MVERGPPHHACATEISPAICDAVAGHRQKKPGRVAAVAVLQGMAAVLHVLAVLLALVVAELLELASAK